MSGRMEGHEVVSYSPGTGAELAGFLWPRPKPATQIREAESGAVAVRHRKHGDQGAKPLELFINEITALVDAKSAAE